MHPSPRGRISFHIRKRQDASIAGLACESQPTAIVGGDDTRSLMENHDEQRARPHRPAGVA